MDIENARTKSNVFWIAVIGAVLLLAALGSFLVWRSESGGNTVCVYLDGELIKTIDLAAVTEPYTFTVECEGGYNVVAVESGRVYVAGADCPDGACMRQGVLRGAAPLVCLPHRLVIKFEGAAAPYVDAVAG